MSSTCARPTATACTRIARGFRVVAYPTPPASCAAYYPETNVLVPLHSVGESGTPTFKSIPVELLLARST